ncbi:PTS system glucose subfamily transporter subunit IIA [Catenovulum agarivorans DS-2]|uniref:PTS system glucose subfamily transporter subunit IIA n=1 Tax=Catenovulum agarivorans DS-2 TaxID=1328313 RepID=W7R427_9ALTE|nr:PTS glucose transporter subunit IIA [Catenovulum agarivorans]EWH12375.1 PTS system glucose subfamily transporter subunit IIA [Catenovulum agarivorans DS-2]
MDDSQTNTFPADIEPIWQIAAPCNGKVQPLSTHYSELIRQGFAGEGICIELYSEQIVSPVNGIVQFISPALDVFRIKCQKGLIVELRLPDIVQDMMRNGFQLKSKLNQAIKAGDILLLCHKQKLTRLYNKVYGNKKPQLLITLPNLPAEYVVQCTFNRVTAAQDFCIKVYPPAKQTQE